jgi:hypothetical protein
MEEAIRNGTYIPPATDKPKLGAKPVLHEVLLDYREEDDEKSVCWPNMMVSDNTYPREFRARFDDTP